MRNLLLCFILFGILTSTTFASDEKPPAKPASNVVVETATAGMLAPTSPFVGTVKFTDISSVAAESAGKIKTVKFEEGDIISRGSILAIIDSELLEKTIAEAEAALGQIEANLQLAQNDYERTAKLYKGNATSEQSYENKKYAAIALEKQKAAQYAAIDNLKAQLNKKMIYAPYNGIVVSKKTSVGEWVSSGSVVAELAKTGAMNIIVNVPEKLLSNMKKGLTVDIEAVGKPAKADFVSVIPSGDVTNRTFPVKFKTNNAASLLQGMEARVYLPTSSPTKVLFINRDAVVTAQGNVFAYTVIDNAAKPMPLKVLGYRGNLAGVQSQALKAGMTVIVKGNERLRPNQAVNIIGK
ncbi:MAG: efflux RND transporter periplasmic adaptor subunit [Denitrovibrio sp.]|nr:MAG: efflux RND transporter periplasmic adaptor subunit [Denitrovibrio sp.]